MNKLNPNIFAPLWKVIAFLLKTLMKPLYNSILSTEKRQQISFNLKYKYLL